VSSKVETQPGQQLSRQTVALAGPFLFTGGITPHAEDGSLVRGLSDVPDATRAATGAMLVDAPTARTVAQTWNIFERLTELLAVNGTSLESILRQRIFLRDKRDIAAVERVMRAFIDPPWPTTSVVELPPKGLHPEINIQIDCIALQSDAPFKKQLIADTESASLYAAAVCAGPLLFASGLCGTAGATGLLATRLDDLPDADVFRDFRLTTERDERILAQTWWIFARLEKLLKESGASLGEILKLNGWLTFMIRDYAPVIDVRHHLFGDEGLPASTALGVQGVQPDGAELIFDAIAVVPNGTAYRKEEPGRSGIGGFYVDVVRAGPFVFTCGEVPIDSAVPRVIESFEDLGDLDGRRIADGGIHAENGAQARAWYVYAKLVQDLERYGSRLDDVVQQTIYLKDLADYPAVEAIAARFFAGTLPPTTVVSITDTSPFMRAELEIDMVAYTA
jgi:enamine deaminase RidA (YjgF/YER057c/UK114 family)